MTDAPHIAGPRFGATTDSTRPDPLVPPGVSLGGNEWFPLYFRRLRKSRWWRTATDLARARNVLLWGEAYQSTPAGSLPDDDDELAEAAGFGFDVPAFIAAKAEIMAPWTLCSDGRWYHPTVCEMALEAWERLDAKRRAEREKKQRQRRMKGESPAAEPVSPDPEPASLGTTPTVPRDNATEGRENAPQDRTEQDTTESANADLAMQLEELDLLLFAEPPAPPAIAEPVLTFDDWWHVWPRKVAKGQAEKNFKEALKAVRKEQGLTSDSAAIAFLIEKTELYTPWYKGMEASGLKHKTPHPGTWLNAKRWLDEEEWTNGTGTSANAGRGIERGLGVLLAGGVAYANARRG